jgi:hypothetical protein
VKLSSSRLPSPALVISCVALFVSLGGVSYGVATGFIDSREIRDNTVRSKDVRNNTLRTFDIRNNEVRGFDIRNSSVQGRDVAFDTLTGVDVRESSLAKVPSAATADTATSATTASSATTAGSVSVLKTIAPTTVAEGASPVTLASHGPLTLTGACEAMGAGTEARAHVQSTEAGSAARNNDVFGPGGTSTPLAEVLDAAAASPRVVGEGLVFASAPSAKSFTGLLGMHADASGAGSCLFHGHVTLEG